MLRLHYIYLCIDFCCLCFVGLFLLLYVSSFIVGFAFGVGCGLLDEMFLLVLFGLLWVGIRYVICTSGVCFCDIPTLWWVSFVWFGVCYFGFWLRGVADCLLFYCVVVGCCGVIASVCLFGFVVYGFELTFVAL